MMRLTLSQNELNGVQSQLTSIPLVVVCLTEINPHQTPVTGNLLPGIVLDVANATIRFNAEQHAMARKITQQNRNAVFTAIQNAV